MDPLGSDVPKFDVTPAELMLLRKVFTPLAGREPITNLELTGEVARSSKVEIERLTVKYGGLKVAHSHGKAPVCEVMFAGEFVALPETFEAIGETNLPIATIRGPQNNNPKVTEGDVAPIIDIPIKGTQTSISTDGQPQTPLAPVNSPKIRK